MIALLARSLPQSYEKRDVVSEILRKNQATCDRPAGDIIGAFLGIVIAHFCFYINCLLKFVRRTQTTPST